MSAVAADPTSSAGALQRAAYEWNKGDYVSALSTYESLLAGPDAAQVLNAIALQTGELYRSVELTTDGANPVFGANGRFSYETGASVVAGIAAGADRVTHVRAVDRPLTDLMTLSGGDASFCPDGRRMAYVKITRTQAVVDAQSALAAATTGAERVQRQQELTRAVSSASVLMLRDLTNGQDDTLQSTVSYRAGSALCAADGIFFTGVSEDRSIAQIYLVKAGSAPQLVTSGPGIKSPLRTDTAGKTLLFSVLGGTETTAAARPQSSFGVLTADGRTSSIDGVAPALSRDGSEVAWIERDLNGSESPGERLMLATTSGHMEAHGRPQRNRASRRAGNLAGWRAHRLSDDVPRRLGDLRRRDGWHGRDACHPRDSTRHPAAVPDQLDAARGHRRTATSPLVPLRPMS